MKPITLAVLLSASVAAASPKQLVLQHAGFGTDLDNKTFDYRAARAVMRTSDAAILACYRKVVEKDPDFVATARLTVEVQPTGRVAKATVDNDVPIALRECIEAIGARWKFKKTGQEFNVNLIHDYELFPLGYGTEQPANSKPQKTQVDLSIPPHVNGSWEDDRGPIGRELARRAASFTSCYTNELKTLPRLRGALVVWFFLDADGVVYEAEAGGLLNKAVTDCVLGVLRARPFPKPPFRADRPEADVDFALLVAPQPDAPAARKK